MRYAAPVLPPGLYAVVLEGRGYGMRWLCCVLGSRLAKRDKRRFYAGWPGQCVRFYDEAHGSSAHARAASAYYGTKELDNRNV